MTAPGARPPRFRLGEAVSVRDLGKPGHVRTPYYVREKTGRVVQYCGLYLNPEDLAVGRSDGPAVHLYRVAFDQRTLWPADGHPPGDRLVIEIYEHWLDAAPTDGDAATDTKDSSHGAA